MKNWPAIVSVDGRFRVDTGRKVVPRRRTLCDTLAEAKEIADTWRSELQAGGSDAALTPKQRHDALQALSLLEEKDASETLSEAVHYFLRHRYPLGTDLKISKLVSLFVEEKRMATREVEGKVVSGFSPVYLRSLHRLEVFAVAMKEKKLSAITSAHVMEWLHSLPLNDFSKRQYYQYLKMLFRYAVKHEYMDPMCDPMKHVPAPRPTAKDPLILTVDETKRMLQSAWDEFDGLYYPCIALGLMCGIRPQELLRLQWRDVQEFSLVRLPAAKTKTRDIRVVHIPTTTRFHLEFWRSQHPGKDTDYLMPMEAHITDPADAEWRYKRFFTRIHRRAGLTHWPKDAARHTFASFYYAAVQDMGKLMMQLGHATPRTSLRHYVHLTQEPWQWYFSLAQLPEYQEVSATLLKSWYTKKMTDAQLANWYNLTT